MSSLTLIRHGQATAFQHDTDRLTLAGEAQARRLAGFWLNQGVGFDEVRSGTLTRQVQTERLVAECFHEAGVPWPEPARDAGWNEYDAGGILRAAAVPLETGVPGTPDEYRRFQLKFEAAMLHWLDGSEAKDGAEPFTAFRDRVTGAIRRVMTGASGRRVAVFTSGGAIGFTVNFAVRGPDRSFLELNWRIRNCSLTGFVFSQDRLTLDSFNQVSHLDDAALHTFR
ncbi:MAG TPA: histidine phosphatase family protein [Candidatus Acidoferrales bacterium]|jgi:broad specificity phosphatase PhoE|nr:histidine phosphatase family protein [Candidatus Acidoferrales bacterium]